LQALENKGRGDAHSLVRQAVAALLNAARVDFNTGHTLAEVIALTKSGWTGNMTKTVHLFLTGNSIGGCPF